MSRQIQKGDLVLIRLQSDNNYGIYIIQDIISNEIYIFPYNDSNILNKIVSINEQWKIFGAENIPYLISFHQIYYLYTIGKNQVKTSLPRSSLIVFPPKEEINIIKKDVLNPKEIIISYPQLSSDKIQNLDQMESLKDDVYEFDDIIIKNFTVYKQGSDEEDLSNFYREIIIGLELNKLNLTNFVETIGYFEDDKCQLPDTSDDDKCIYLYLKKIKGSTLRESLTTLSLIQFKDILIKLIFAYKQSLDKLDFTHYDLHDNNIIISIKDGELIPVIIDFGFSHIKLRKSNLGEDFTDEGIYPDRSNWIYDFFKLLCFCWKAVPLDDIGEYCILLLRFFNKDVSLGWLREYHDYNSFYSSWLTDEGKKINFNDFINFGIQN